MPTDPTKQNGWNEWSKLVLSELDRLDESMKEMQETMVKCHVELASIKPLFKRVERAEEKITTLVAFRNQSIAIFSLVQIAVGITFAWMLRGL